MNERHELTTCAAVDSLSTAVFIISFDLKILFLNKAAKELLDEGSFLRAKDNCVRCGSRQKTTKLGEAVTTLLSADADASQPASIELPLSAQRGSRRAVLATLLALEPLKGAVALIVSWSGQGGRFPEKALTDGFGLSQTESRVVRCLFDAMAPAEIGLKLNLSVNTVKSHLRRIYKKTGTEGQAGLLRLLHELQTPLRDL